MATTKVERVYRKVRDSAVHLMCDAFKKKFDIEIESEFNIFDMRRVSRRVDNVDFLPEHKEFIGAFELGYYAALALIEE